MDEPESGVGDPVVGPAERVRRDVQHPRRRAPAVPVQLEQAAGCRAAASRSASLSAAQTHSRSAWLASGEQARDHPAAAAPGAELAVLAAGWNEIGPRFDATRTRPPPAGSPIYGEATGRVRPLAPPWPGDADSCRWRRPDWNSGHLRLQWSPQLNIAHPEGWRDRPGEAPATITRRSARPRTCRRGRLGTGANSGPRLVRPVGQMRREASS